MLSILKSEKVLKLNNNWKFEWIISLLFILFGIIGWQTFYIIGALPVIILSIGLILIYNNFKYAIPAILVLLFSYNNGFDIDHFPFEIVIPVVLFVGFIFWYTIKNFKKSYLSYPKTCIGMLILSVGFIIPIFWSKAVGNNTVLYIMYFSWLLYTLLYLLLCCNLKKDCFRIVVFTLSWLSVLITYELVISAIRFHIDNPDESILDFWAYIGWGLCNEAGIMLCFLMPFVFYEFFKSKTMSMSLISLFKIFLLIGGILVTTSRGSILFGGLEAISLFILSLILKYDNKKMKLLFSFLAISLIVSVAMVFINRTSILEDVINIVFHYKFTANGRDLIWKAGKEFYLSSPLTIILGSGIVSEITELSVYGGVQNTFNVYHNTILEVLVSAGIPGLIGLCIHLFEKYKMLIKKGWLFGLVFTVGYLFVDLYGLIDNTYGMYYYMVPLAIVLATFMHAESTELYDEVNNNLF